jgi:hypothetical protein
VTVPVRVGFGTAGITPEGPVYLAGFAARTEPALSVHDELEARAVLIQQDDDRLLLIVCDLLGMSVDVAREVRQAVAADVDLPLDRVLTACTHTHTGPSVIRGSERLGWPTPEGYERQLVDGCVAAARAAIAAAEPADLFCARRPLPAHVSMNRRQLPYDPTFAVLDARRPDGTTIGTLANVGIHPVALGVQCLQVSTDWVGPFRRALAGATGGGATLLQGSLGDVNPTEPHHHDDAGDYHHAEHIGVDVARAVLDTLAGLEPVTGPVGRAVRRTISAPVGTTPLTGLAGLTGSLDVDLVEWEVGSVRLVSIPGEAFHAFGNAVQASRDREVILAGLAPAWQGYLPMPWGEGYEETVSYGEEFVAAVHQHLLIDPFAG